MRQNPSNTDAVGVIDIGSNSIKLLIATRGPDGSIKEHANQTLEARLGGGLSRNPPELEPAAIDGAVEAVATLIARAETLGTARIRIVATSAVRDAVNGPGFVERLRERTGRDTEVLTNLEEARLIGRGVACDPGMSGIRECSLFDLGGGSLEMLVFESGVVAHMASVPLGCVRLSGRFFSDPTRPIPDKQITEIRNHVTTVLHDSGFPFQRCAGITAVLTGGTATTLRAIRAAAQETPLIKSPRFISAGELEDSARTFSGLTIDERRNIPGLSKPRADVFPAALWTLATLANVAEIRQFVHSLHNLRFGVAADLLDR